MDGAAIMSKDALPARSDECWNAEAETIAPGALRRIEQDRLKRHLTYVWSASRFYRRKWEDAGMTAQGLARLDDLAQLPFTEKRELHDAQDDPPPFGANQCAPLDRLIRMQATGGTSGDPLRMGLTRHDIDVYNELGARAAWAAGLRPGDILLECMNYSLYAGGVNDHMTFETLGACVAPVGIGQSRRLVAILRRMRVPTALYSTPSYALHLADVARAEGVNPTDLRIAKGLLSGDAGLGIPEYRRQIEAAWNMVARDIYGLGELGPLAAECRDACEAHPLIRFRSHDHVRIVGTGPCACGRTGFRFRVLGRSDDMFIVKGINVYPLGVHDVILGMQPALTGEFQILLPDPPPITEPPVVRAECGPGVGAGEHAQLRDRLAARLRDRLVFTARVELVSAGSLPRTERKAKRLYRLYLGEQP